MSKESPIHPSSKTISENTSRDRSIPIQKSTNDLNTPSPASNLTARRIKLLRILLIVIGYLWILALPYEGLWKSTYIDEHSLQPAQVTMYWDWNEVHKADKYLERLEGLVNSTNEERSAYLVQAFSEAGLTSGDTGSAVYASVKPPRSAGTETILISANWVSRDGGWNLRGVATLLAMGDFLRGQNHWAFDIVLIVGNDYLSGLSSFMSTYHDLFSGVVWTALNIDYPGHSFSHLGVFYEGLNGRLPNQDIPNTIAHVGKWAGGVEMRLHDVDNNPPEWVGRYLGWIGGEVGEAMKRVVGRYVVGARHLWEHGKYMALGRASGAHGVMAKYRIDSSTLYCTPSSGPHGFHTLGRVLESTLRSLNNLLERLHASYFFYLLPSPGHFIPVGNYLPSAIALGSSVVIGGLACPQPPSFIGISYMVLAFLIGGLGWMVQSPLVALLAILIPGPNDDFTRDTINSLTHLLYGAMIPTLAMLNFPQAMMLATITIAYLNPWIPGRWAALVLLHPALAQWGLSGMKEEWTVLGNMFWPGVFIVWVPLWVIAVITARRPPNAVSMATGRIDNM